MTDTERSFGGRYEVIERVGSGGMAEVYRARDDLLGRTVALKVLSDRLSSDRSFVERFRREARAAANLSHPNIVSLFDYGADRGTYFIVMEYIDGRVLADVIKEDGPLMPERAAEIAADVAKGLDRAHSAGLVHRDIKPSNIMLTSSGETKVTDFGIARAIGGDGEATMTQTGMVIGTASYLSPEQAQGNPVDARSDVYSLGCVLYEMLTGQAPFTGDTPLAIAYKHVREDAVAPSKVNRHVPVALDAVAMKAMAKNPDNRYQSAAEMREDLERYLSGQRVLATPLLGGETALAPAADTGTQVLRETHEAEGRERRRAGFYILSALALLILFGVLAVILFNNLLGGNVEVPDVRGERESEAIDILEKAGFDADPQDRPSQKPVGRVAAQDPQAGESAPEGSTVVIFVSSGPREVEVPSLAGLPLDEAKDELRRAGLKVGEITREPSDDFEEGRVIRQSISPGIGVPADTEIDLTVSSGPQGLIVPNVLGQTEEQARDNLENAGFVVETDSVPSDEPAGIVIAQDPEGGSEARRGDTVRITVSEGPEERAMPNVRGQDGDDAEAFLEADYGLNVSQVEDDGGCLQPPGTVCDQDPEPDTPVSPGDSATLFIQPGGAGVPDDDRAALLIPFALLLVLTFVGWRRY